MKGKNLSEGGHFMNTKREIMKKLQSITGKYSINTVFIDWIHLMAYTCSNTLDQLHFEEREALYLTIIKKYSKDQVTTFCECFALLTIAFEENSIDWLGEIYMELNLANSSLGQCFTPNHVAKLMAELTFVSGQTEVLESGRMNYYEPCCGSGSMIIGLISVMQKKGYNAQTQLIVHCEDLDENCLLMTYVQLSLLGISAICQVKNSLTNEVFSTWYTPFLLKNSFNPNKH